MCVCVCVCVCVLIDTWIYDSINTINNFNDWLLLIGNHYNEIILKEKHFSSLLCHSAVSHLCHTAVLYLFGRYHMGFPNHFIII